MIKFQIHSQSWQFVHLHQTSGATSDSKWDEVRHIFFPARRISAAPLGSLLSRKRQLMKKTLKRRLEGRKLDDVMSRCVA